MALAQYGSGSQSAPEPSDVHPAGLQLWDDPVLRIAFSAAGLLLAFQLVMTLLQPPWTAPVTGGLEMLLGWSGLLLMVLVSWWFTRMKQPAARSWWCVSAGLLANALARTVRLVEILQIYPRPAAGPSLADLIAFLQYPCYLLALLPLLQAYPTIRRTLMIVDGCLILGSGAALAWYFLLAPIYQSSHETPLGKLVSLSFPVGDLAIFFGLMMIWLRFRVSSVDRLVVVLLFVAIVCLLVNASWHALLLLSTSSYQEGHPPSLFEMAFLLFVPLAGLLQLRLTQGIFAGGAGKRARPVSPQPSNLRRQDLFAGLRVTVPVAAAVLVSAMLFVRAELVTSALHPVSPPLIALGLLLLALVRQGLTAVDNERLRREREETLRATTAQMETYLGIVGHELKNPLAGIQLGVALIERRVRRLLGREQVAIEDIASLLEPVVRVEHQDERLGRLVDDLVDSTRVGAGQLELHPAPTDLADLVHQAVEEQRTITPARTIRLELLEEQPVPVLGDAQRLWQVVTNYLTNALKYSPEDRPVTVGLQVRDQQARVWVHDEGPGLTVEEQKRIWERFYRAPDIPVQSGGGVGLGLGLHVSRTIVELHHGQVGVQSTPGQGSTFWLSLPMGTAAAVVGGKEDAAEGAPPEGGQQP
jgi:signal transduction histidine kinase